MFTFSILTFGCRVNQADSFACEAGLVAAGGVEAGEESADLVVVNTCSVTAAADQAARQAIRRIGRRNPSARIMATGCYATRRPDDLSGLPGVVAVVPNEQKGALAQNPAFAGFSSSWDPAFAGLSAISALDRAKPRPGDRGRTAFPLRVQTGCDERCTYCTIPATRGPSRSRPLAGVLSDVRALADAGYKELILTGVQLGAYGRDLAPATSLLDLLAALDRLPGDVRFRISSIEPMDCTPALVGLVAASGRFAPHFHLPLQHGSNRVLRAMRRPYSLDDYRRVVEGIRAKLPDAAVGCDLIAGFPGETAADHRATIGYLAASGLTHVHVFPYSDRPGTPAAALRPKVAAAVARERCGELHAISRLLAAAFARRHIGRVRPGLTIGDGTRVLTDNYLKVRIPRGCVRNERVVVRVTGDAPLTGEVVR